MANMTNNTTGQVELKSFDQTITIEIPVDVIAKKLYDTMDKSNPHAALITNTIIGFGLLNSTLTPLYNALNGWKDEVNITVGKTYTCPANRLNVYGATSDWKALPIVEVVVETVNEYTTASDNIQVRFTYAKKDKEGATDTATSWISHKHLVESADNLQVSVPYVI